MKAFDPNPHDDIKWKDSISRRFSLHEIIIFFFGVLHLISFSNQYSMIRLLAIHSDKLTPDGVEVMMSTKLDTKITQNLPTIVQVAHSNYKKIQQAKYTVLHSEETFTPIESSSTDSLRNTNKHENEHPKHLSIVRSFPASAESQHQNPTISRNLRLLSNQTTENIFVTTDTIMRNQFCYEKPDLAPRNHLNNFTFDQRIQSMMNVIEKLSTSQLLHDFFSHQYKAACHIVFDDVFGNFSDMNLNEEKLIQRYAMVVFLYSMKQEEALPLPMDICDFAKDHIECNSKGQVTKIDWRNLGKYFYFLITDIYLCRSIDSSIPMMYVVLIILT